MSAMNRQNTTIGSRAGRLLNHSENAAIFSPAIVKVSPLSSFACPLVAIWSLRETTSLLAAVTTPPPRRATMSLSSVS